MTSAPPAILWRIAVRLALTTLVAIALAYSWLWWKYDSATQTIRNRTLADHAALIGHHVTLDKAGAIHVDLPPEMLAAYEGSSGDFRFAVRDQDKDAVLAEGGGPVGDPPDNAVGGNTPSLYLHNPDGPGPILMFGVANPIHVGNHRILVQVEQSGRDFEALTRALLMDFAEDGGWLGAPFLLAMLLVSLYTIRSSLRPLRNLSELAESIGPDSTEIRLPEAEVPREILPLVRAVNSALDRLDAGFTIQREFTADAAHELRTPLAVLRAHIDTLPDPETRVAQVKDLDGMTRLIGQMLGVAQVEALVIASDETADLNAVAADVGAFLAPMALRNDRLIEVIETEPAPVVHGSPEAIFNALRNLVENALTHTPADTTVTVRVLPPAVIQVEDKGPGVPPDWRERVFQRFWRAERRKSGAGLGLAIVKRTMEAHGGSVAIGDAEGGGALFSLTFPATAVRTK